MLHAVALFCGYWSLVSIVGALLLMAMSSVLRVTASTPSTASETELPKAEDDIEDELQPEAETVQMTKS